MQKNSTRITPSGNSATMRLFKLAPGVKPIDGASGGVTADDPRKTGRLVTFSVVDAFDEIRKSTNERREAAQRIR
ncbi:hypothetical protein [Polyangium sp. 6x1]|uniref:hypothetical protein n=1 Tax=Polyangium sp. 6x1 TaxID=3042689 RepID=UPI0024827273|nr:hypothetical protein [Polyangium sp. 6x1]MDI1444214.1 hypothetical protein [Polyangium sp. 6x1]